LVADVLDFRREEFQDETIYGNDKEFDGIKNATKVEGRRNGEVYRSQEISDFNVLDKVPAETFAKPN
jgi:hypothetical protein